MEKSGRYGRRGGRYDVLPRTARVLQLLQNGRSGSEVAVEVGVSRPWVACARWQARRRLIEVLNATLQMMEQEREPFWASW